MEIPKQPAFIIQRLLDAGYQAYVVGGCVRDALLGLAPNDWDVCTSALPCETKAVFAEYKSIDVGIQHGTVAVVLEGQPYEVTTLRTDGTYQDHRRPDSVRFVTDVREDLLRRDFTVNAMAYNHRDGLVDVCGAQQDLKDGILRTVGEPDLRFGEDALRIMRCLRFAAVFGFHIESGTAAAAVKKRGTLVGIAAERLNTELSKLLLGGYAPLVLADYRMVLAVFLPELGRLPAQAYQNTVNLLAKTPAVLPMRMAVLFGGLDGARLAALLRRMKYSNKIMEETLQCHRFTQPVPSDPAGLKLLLAELGFHPLGRILALKELAGEDVASRRSLLEQVRQNGDCISVRQLAVDGSQLASLGLQGKEIGDALQFLLLQVIQGNIQNQERALLAALAAREQ